MASTVGSPSRHLSGQYKDFFATKAHPTVEHWYLHEASNDARGKMKSVVTKVLAFNLEKAKAKLRTTYDPNIIKANAIFEKNNGHQLISKATIPSSSSASTPTTYQERTVQWLSFASISDQNNFRATIGMMVPPNRFSTHRHVDDFDLTKKYWKSDSQITEHKSLVCGNLLHKPSEMYEIECEAIAKHGTHTGTQYSWKTATLSRAQRNGSMSTVTKRAHDATFTGAPWGVYGTPGDPKANATQWLSQTKEDFSDTFFVQNRKERRFQNFNENYISLLTRQYTDQQKELKATNNTAGAAGPSSSAAARGDVNNATAGQQQQNRGNGVGGALRANSALDGGATNNTTGTTRNPNANRASNTSALDGLLGGGARKPSGSGFAAVAALSGSGRHR